MVTAIDFLSCLQNEVGPRRAGTAEEQRAQEWLKARCEEMGLTVEYRDFNFIKSDNVRRAISLLSLAYIVAFILFSRRLPPLVTAVAILLNFYYLARVHKHVVLRLAQSVSRNVIAGLRRCFSDCVGGQERPLILICAHYDTPRNMPPWIMKLLDAMRVIGPLVNLVIILFIAYQVIWGIAWAVWRLLGVGEGLYAALGGFWSAVGYWIVLVVMGPIVVLNVAVILDMALRPQGDSPGADDNGSGTALVLDMADRLTRRPLQNADVFFAFWGAEELGLFGSRQFVRQCGDRLDKDRTYVINADVVGAGDRLLIHTGQGVVFRRSTAPETVAALERICDEQGVAYIRSWESLISGGSSDHAEWVERGFKQSVSFIRENYRPISAPARLLAWLLRIPDPTQLELRHIHTPNDTMDAIDEEALGQTVDVCEAYVRRVDRLISYENGR